MFIDMCRVDITSLPLLASSKRVRARDGGLVVIWRWWLRVRSWQDDSRLGTFCPQAAGFVPSVILSTERTHQGLRQPKRKLFLCKGPNRSWYWYHVFPADLIAAASSLGMDFLFLSSFSCLEPTNCSAILPEVSG